MATKALTAEQMEHLDHCMRPHLWPNECAAETALRLLAEKDVEIARLKAIVGGGSQQVRCYRIVQLEAKIAELKAALEPFATAYYQNTSEDRLIHPLPRRKEWYCAAWLALHPAAEAAQAKGKDADGKDSQ